jgi:hypothetical protein
MVSVGDEGGRMLMVGSGDTDCSGVLERRGGLGNEITVFCFRGEVAKGEEGRKFGLRGNGASTVGDLAGFLAGTGGGFAVGMLTSRRSKT